MRALFLTIALMAGSLGLVASTPSKADAQPRGWGWYSYDYGRPNYWRGGSRWRGGSWRGRSYYGGYYRPRYYGRYYYPAPYYGSYYYSPGYYSSPGYYYVWP
jgi:hypothetical protein